MNIGNLRHALLHKKKPFECSHEWLPLHCNGLRSFEMFFSPLTITPFDNVAVLRSFTLLRKPMFGILDILSKAPAIDKRVKLRLNNNSEVIFFSHCCHKNSFNCDLI